MVHAEVQLAREDAIRRFAVEWIKQDIKDHVKKTAAHQQQGVTSAGIPKDKKYLHTPAVASPSGSNVGGRDQAILREVTDRISDEDHRRRILGPFKIGTKYDGLNALINPRNEMATRYPKEIAEIVNRLTELDIKAKSTVPLRRY